MRRADSLACTTGARALDTAPLGRRGFLAGLLGAPLVVRAAATPPVRWVVVEQVFVAGFRFHDGPAVQARLLPGDDLRLEPEPDNPHDGGAVAIWHGSYQLGYLPRVRNPMPGGCLAQGIDLRARVALVDLDAPSWQRVQVDLLLPVPA